MSVDEGPDTYPCGLCGAEVTRQMWLDGIFTEDDQPQNRCPVNAMHTGHSITNWVADAWAGQPWLS